MSFRKFNKNPICRVEREEGLESEPFHLPIIQDGKVDTSKFTGKRYGLEYFIYLFHTLREIFL